MKTNRVLMFLILTSILILAACQPEVVEVVKEVPIEQKVTVEVEKEVEVVVTATPEPMPEKCTPLVDNSNLLKPETIIWSINATIPPFQYIDDEGNLQGERYVLGEMISERLCLESEWVNIQWEAVIPGLQGGRWDSINSGMYYTDERVELMELVPYEVSSTALSVAWENPLGIESEKDLSGLPVAVECPGFESEAVKHESDLLVEEGKDPMDVRCFTTYADAYQALRAEQVVAVWIGTGSAKWREMQGEFTRVGLELGGGTAQCLAFANTELAQAVADVLNDMLADGSYDALLDEWGGGKITDLWDQWPGEFKVY